MSSTGFILVPVRWISRSLCRPKTFRAGSLSKNELNIKEEVKVPTETDTHKLATNVCGTNLFVEGGEDVKIKPDSEYPAWLWTMRSPLPLEELDKNSKTYWNRVRRIREKEMKYIKSLQRNTSVHK